MGCGSSSTGDSQPVVRSTQQTTKTVLNNNNSEQKTLTSNGTHTKTQASTTSVTKSPTQNTQKNPPSQTTPTNPLSQNTSKNSPSQTTQKNPPSQTTPTNPPSQNTPKNSPSQTTPTNPPSKNTPKNPPSQTTTKNSGNTISSLQYAKELTFNLKDFQHIDEHARQAPKSVEKSIETLAAYLAQPCTNQLERVRALYVWVCENISYDTDAYFGDLKSTTTKGTGVLESKSSVCSGYANLYEDLCVSLGINCKKISGYAKGYSYKPGEVISYDKKTNHAWNVVELDGVWRFLETTWGAGHVDKNKKFVKQFNDFYFLTPAENFIDDHFPYINNDKDESKIWQLLKNPISIETYSKMIKRSKEAREFGVEFPSHPFEVIEIKDSCSIIVQSKSANVLQKIWCNLVDDKTSYDECAMILKENDSKYKITIRPKHKGRFQLKINATIANCERNTQLVMYMIDCVSVESDYKPYPKNGSFYGPRKDFIERGFEMSSATQPFHTCKNGEFSLEIKTSSVPEITTTMFDGDNVDQKNYTMVEQVDNKIYLRARFTKKGYYKISIFSKFETDSFTEAAVFLVRSLHESGTTSMFPLTYTTTRKYKSRLIEPLVRDIPGNSEVNFKFSCAEFTELLVSKKKYNKENNDIWNITVETGESGEIKLSGKPKDENTYWPVYVFNIKS